MIENEIENILYENIHSVRGDVDGIEKALSLILEKLEAHIEAQKRISEVHVGETMIDRIPDVDWTDQDIADWEIAVGKHKESKA